MHSPATVQSEHLARDLVERALQAGLGGACVRAKPSTSSSMLNLLMIVRVERLTSGFRGQQRP